MAGIDGQRDSADPSGTGDPGPLSRLLQELADAPGEDALLAWKCELRAGDRVGRFEIRREVGRGGFGAVYEAFDTQLNRTVAVKALRLRRPRSDLSTDWMKQEAEAVARLDHPCIVTLFDVGSCSSGPYLVMELLRGETLARRIAGGPMSSADALRIAEEMAKGLAHAHERGVLHRDLKPANVFLCEDGRVKLLDFGLAHLLGSQDAKGAGTPAYMAPEQARGEEVDQRADVFAAGRVLGEMLGERRPGRLDQVVASATSIDPTARPRDGRAWLDVLQATRRALDRPARLRRLALLGGFFLLLGVLVAGMATWRIWRTQFLEDGDGRITVAVADFANQTGDPALDGLSGLLITSLEQSKKLRVVTRGRMSDHLRALGKENAERIDEPLAREVGRRSGARALLLAGVRRLDDVYVVEMRAFDPQRDDYLFTMREQTTGKKGLLSLIDRLSDWTRAELHDPEGSLSFSRVRVADATTASLEAYEHYFRGRQLDERSLYDDASAEYRKAIAADPNFALAHYQIAVRADQAFLGRDVSMLHAEAAVAQAGKLGRKDQLLIQAWKAHLDGRNDEAHRLYEQAAESWPEEKEVLYMAGDLHFHEGACEKALPYFERARQLDPHYEPALIHVAQCLRSQGKGAEFLDLSRRWVERAPGPTSHRMLAYALAMNGRLDEALASARRGYEMQPTPLTRDALATVLLQRAAFAEVEALLRPSVLGGQRPTIRDPVVQLSAAIALQGRSQDALAALEPMREPFPETYHPQRFVRLLCAGQERGRAGGAGDPGPRMAGSGQHREGSLGCREVRLRRRPACRGDPARGRTGGDRPRRLAERPPRPCARGASHPEARRGGGPVQVGR